MLISQAYAHAPLASHQHYSWHLYLPYRYMTSTWHLQYLLLMSYHISLTCLITSAVSVSVDIWHHPHPLNVWHQQYLLVLTKHLSSMPHYNSSFIISAVFITPLMMTSAVLFSLRYGISFTGPEIDDIIFFFHSKVDSIPPPDVYDISFGSWP